MRRFARALATGALAVGLTAIPPAGAEPLAGASKYVPVTPARILDTRASGKVAAGATRDVHVAGTAGVPADATAVVLNVTVTRATGPGYLAVYPTGAPPATEASSLNVERVDQTIANTVITPVGAGGNVTVFLQGGGDLLVDVFGAFVVSTPSPSSRDGRFVPVAPARLLDTRSGDGVALTNPGDTKDCGDFPDWDSANAYFWTYYAAFGDVAKLDVNNDLYPCESLGGARSTTPKVRPADLFRTGAKGSVRVQVRGRGGVPASGVTAVAVNLTAVAASPGFVQATPTSSTFGAWSNLNVSTPGQTIPSFAIVPIAADGTITLYTESPAHLLLDVFGWFTDSSADLTDSGLFVPLRPTRVLDTRNNIGTNIGRLGPKGSAFVNLANVAGVPFVAGAVFLNVTATDAAPGFEQIGPSGMTLGAHSNLNVGNAGQTIANAAIIPAANLGFPSVHFYSEAGAHLLADIAGYFIYNLPPG